MIVNGVQSSVELVLICAQEYARDDCAIEPGDGLFYFEIDFEMRDPRREVI